MYETCQVASMCFNIWYMWIFAIFKCSFIHAMQFCEDIESNGPAQICTNFANYSKTQFPQPFPCLLDVLLDVQDIIKIDENEQTIQLIVKITKAWNDTRVSLKFNEENKPINFPWFHFSKDTDVWIPKIHFFNSIDTFEVSAAHDELEYQEPSQFYLVQNLNLKLSCEMTFHEFPFDTHLCFILFDNVFGGTKFVVFNQIQVVYHPGQNSYFGNAEKHQFDVTFEALNSTDKCDHGYCVSQGNIQLKLERKQRELWAMVAQFYLPTFTFGFLALISYFIPIETVPGRMGLLVTLYLIATNLYISFDAPANRGFSYLDLWMLGTILPIITAILEYGILLAVSKYGHGTFLGKTVHSKQIDLITFGMSLSLMVIFDVSYWLVGMGKL